MNSRFAGGEPDEDLTPELKAMEAALATLCPREDGLDRDRLIFLAGQAAAARPAIGWSSRAWPAAFAGMSAIAATLLVMLLVQTRTPERAQISVTAEPPQREVGQVKPNAERIGQPRPVTAPSTETGFSDNTSAVLFPGAARFRSRAVYLETCSWMLMQGVDPWERPLSFPAEANDGPSAGPLSYHQWRRTLLEDQAGTNPPADRGNLSFESGANS